MNCKVHLHNTFSYQVTDQHGLARVTWRQARNLRMRGSLLKFILHLQRVMKNLQRVQFFRYGILDCANMHLRKTT